MIISIGMTIQTIYSDFEIFIDDHFMSPPTLMVAIGILLLFVSSFGCVGAIKESTMLINVVSDSNLYPPYNKTILIDSLPPKVWSPLDLHLHPGTVCSHCRLRPPQSSTRNVAAHNVPVFGVLQHQGLRPGLRGHDAGVRKSLSFANPPTALIKLRSFSSSAAV